MFLISCELFFLFENDAMVMILFGRREAQLSLYTDSYEESSELRDVEDFVWKFGGGSKPQYSRDSSEHQKAFQTTTT